MLQPKVLLLVASLLSVFSCKTVTEEYTTSPRDPEKANLP